LNLPQGGTGSAPDRMKLLFCTDLHGDPTQYERLHRLASRVHPDCIVLGGDLLPDDNALDRPRLGRGQPDFVRGPFRQAVQALRDGVGCGSILVIFGNHDWTTSVGAMQELADEGLVSVLDLSRAAQVDGVHFVGYSSTPPTPWYVKDFERLDCNGDEPPLLGGARWDARFNRPSQQAADVLFERTPSMEEELADFRPPPAPWVFVAHAPPYGTRLDQSNTKESWGSRAVLAAIQKHQPTLSLHGHVHESPDVSGSCRDEIGSTVAVNPGRESFRLNYAVIEMDVGSGTITRVEHGHES